MPVKNAEVFLEECLQSIIGQTCKDWELIAIDDHSDDQSAKLLDVYSQHDQRISWHHNSGNGIIEALRQAYGHSTGEYITRMDADDLMVDNKLELLLAVLSDNDGDTVATAFVEYFPKDLIGDGYKKYAAWLNVLSGREDNFSEIYKECSIASPCWMVHRESLDACGAFQSDIYPEDYDLCFRFRNAGFTVKSVKEVLHMWRDHEDRASRSDPHYQDNRFLDLKLFHFFKHDYKKTKRLVIWGAGKKAKLTAQKLIGQGITFDWICNNEKKIGKEIYGVYLQSSDSIIEFENNQVIVQVANEVEQNDIKNLIASKAGVEVFYFC